MLDFAPVHTRSQPVRAQAQTFANEALPPALSISEINERAKRLLEGNFANIFIEGEVSKMSAAGSYRHWYFSLKDASSKIECAYFNPPAGTRQPQVGEKIILRGRISLYTKDARYQFVANRIYATDQRGAMHEIYLKLFEKLRAAGVFDRSRPLAASFRSVGIITSASSAAMADILRIRSELGDLCTRVAVYDSLVQGETAAKSLLNALQRADLAGHDVLLLTRGGGSKEDLFCFNDEALAVAISRAKTPVIAAIGHEVDQHLADFAADLSLPTPSAAARRIFFDMQARLQEQDAFCERLAAAKERALVQRAAKLELAALKLVKNPFNEYLIKLDSYKQIINKTAKTALQNREQQLAQAMPKERAQNALQAKLTRFNLQKNSLKPALLSSKIRSEQAALENCAKRCSKAISVALARENERLENARRAANAQLGFLNSMRKTFILKSEQGAQICSLGELARGDVICISQPLNAAAPRRAQIID